MDKSSPFTTPVGGSRLDAVSTKRQMKIFAITDSDLDLLAITNTVATGFLGVSGFLAAILWDVFRDYGAITDKVVKDATENLMVGLTAMLFVSLLVSVIAFVRRWGKHRQIKQSEVITELESGESG